MKTSLSIALLTLAAHSAFAADIYQATPSGAPVKTQRGERGAQLYGGGTIGPSYVDFDCGPIPDCKHESTGFKLYAGFNATAHIAAELGYLGFGKGSAAATLGSLPITLKQEATALVLNGAFRFDMTPNFTGTVRVGLANVKTKASGSVLGIRGSNSETKVAPYLGLGLECTIAQDLRIVAAVDATQSEIDDEKSDVRLISLGLQYGF